MDQVLRVQVERQLQRFTFDYDARRVQAAMAVQFGQLERFRDAFTLLQAMPFWIEAGSWDGDWYKRPQLGFKFANREQIKPILSLYRTLAKVASEWQVPRVILTWKGADPKRSYQIVASMGEGDDIFDIPPPLNLDVSIAETMRLGEVIRKSQFPMGLVVNTSDWQVWGNQPLSVMCDKPLEELVRMNVRANWVDRAKRTDDGLSTVKERLATEPDGFDLKYTTKVSPEAVGKTRFHSNFQLVLNGRCRLTTIYNYQAI